MNFINMEPMVRFELTTYALRVRCSTPEPHRHVAINAHCTLKYLPYFSSTIALLLLYPIQFILNLWGPQLFGV